MQAITGARKRSHAILSLKTVQNTSNQIISAQNVHMYPYVEESISNEDHADVTLDVTRRPSRQAVY